MIFAGRGHAPLRGSSASGVRVFRADPAEAEEQILRVAADSADTDREGARIEADPHCRAFNLLSQPYRGDRLRCAE